MRAITVVLVFWIAAGAAAQTASPRPPLFFREDWKEIPPATPVTQEHVMNPRLQLALYGPGRNGIRKSHHSSPEDDPYYVWSGSCTGNWAVALRPRDSYVDLTGLGKIRWRTKQTGFRELHLILKLSDGAWLVSDFADGPTSDWHEREFSIADIRWRLLDIQTIVEGPWFDHPDLSKVDEIGWTDLSVGGNTPASSRVDWIEVYGNPIPRRRLENRPAGK